MSCGERRALLTGANSIIYSALTVLLFCSDPSCRLLTFSAGAYGLLRCSPQVMVAILFLQTNARFAQHKSVYETTASAQSPELGAMLFSQNTVLGMR